MGQMLVSAMAIVAAHHGFDFLGSGCFNTTVKNAVRVEYFFDLHHQFDHFRAIHMAHIRRADPAIASAAADAAAHRHA